VAADLGQPAGASEDLLPLLVGELSESGPATDLLVVGVDEPLQARLEEPDCFFPFLLFISSVSFGNTFFTFAFAHPQKRY